MSSPTIVLNVQASGVFQTIAAINQVQEATRKLDHKGGGGLAESFAGGELLAHGLEKAAEFVKDFAKESIEAASAMATSIEKSQVGGSAFQELAYAAKFFGASMDTISMNPPFFSSSNHTSMHNALQAPQFKDIP